LDDGRSGEEFRYVQCMLLAAALLVCIGTVPLFGGRLEALAELELRARWTLVAALGTQLTIVYVVPDAPRDLLSGAHLCSYLFAIGFLWANRRVPGLVLIALGGASNLTVIAANGGVMPASRSALQTAGLEDTPGQFASSIAVGHPKLAFLGDVFAVPASFPVHNVFSVGDVVIVIGAFVLLHRVCDSALFRHRRQDFRALVRDRSFMRVWSALAVSNFGDWTYTLAVLTTLVDRSTAPHGFAALLIAQVGPAALAGALGGPLIDKLPRKGVMITADAARFAAVGSLLVVNQITLPHLYFVAACIGLFGALFGPSLKASLPNLVPANRIVAANALLLGTFHTAIMVGPVAGAMIAAAYGPELALGLNATSFALSGLLIAGVRIRRSEPPTESSPGRALVEGFRYTLATPLARGVMLIVGLIMVGAAVRTPLEPLFVLRILAENPAALGLATGSWGLGMVIGSGVAPALAARWPRERLLAISLLGVGTAVIGSAQATSLNPVLGLWLIAGLGNAVAVISYQSLLQERTPDRVRGRVVAASEAVLDSSLILGALLAGSLGELVGIRGTFAVSGAVFLLTAALARVLLGRGQSPERPPMGVEPHAELHTAEALPVGAAPARP
jgi:MFS family permease